MPHLDGSHVRTCSYGDPDLIWSADGATQEQRQDRRRVVQERRLQKEGSELCVPYKYKTTTVTQHKFHKQLQLRFVFFFLKI